nr:reverse transcriptase domain-containing protein [Tanacetum cinerariifolium]
MESVFHISNCAVECHMKYATCTLLNGALIWWNSHVRTVGHDAAYEMSWKDLMKMMTKAYCPRNEIQKLESKLWNLTVKDETIYKEWKDIMARVATTASSLEAKQDNGNINKTQSKATLNELVPQGTGSGSGPRCQVTILGDVEAQTRYALTVSPTIYASCVRQFWTTAKVKKRKIKLKRKQRQATEVHSPSSKIPVKKSIPTPSNDPLPSGQDSIQLNELMISYTNIQQQVLDLEELKTAQAKEIANLKKRVKKLEKRRK